MTTPRRASLLGLPAEIRQHIWSFCRPDDALVIYYWYRGREWRLNKNPGRRFRRRNNMFDVPTLLLVNHQIYNEALQFCQREVRLCFASGANVFGDLPYISYAKRALVTRLACVFDTNMTVEAAKKYWLQQLGQYWVEPEVLDVIEYWIGPFVNYSIKGAKRLSNELELEFKLKNKKSAMARFNAFARQKLSAVKSYARSRIG